MLNFNQLPVKKIFIQPAAQMMGRHGGSFTLLAWLLGKKERFIWTMLSWVQAIIIHK